MLLSSIPNLLKYHAIIPKLLRCHTNIPNLLGYYANSPPSSNSRWWSRYQLVFRHEIIEPASKMRFAHEIIEPARKMRFSEDVGSLISRANRYGSNCAMNKMLTNKVTIIFNVFGFLMEGIIMSNLTCTSIITKKQPWQKNEKHSYFRVTSIAKGVQKWHRQGLDFLPLYWVEL